MTQHQSSSAEEAPCIEVSLIALEPKTSTSIFEGSFIFLALFSAAADSVAACFFAYLGSV